MTTQTDSRYPDLPGFAKENRELVYAMSEAGWRGRITSKGHFLAKAPDGKTQITVPAKNGNNRGLKNSHASFMRWLREHMPTEERIIFDAAKGADDPLVQDVIAEGLVRKQMQRLTQEGMQRSHDEFMEALMADPRVTIEPLVRPWLARKQPGTHGGTRYESQAVMERVWPDGRPDDYVCSFPGCGYTSGKPRSVAGHYGAAHSRNGERPAEVGPLHPDPEYTEPTTTRDYRPTQRLVDTLTEVLSELQGQAPQVMAEQILRWMHDRPDIDHEPRPLVPLTDADIVNRIRMLVGQPDLSTELAERTRERDEVTARLLKVQRDLDSLRELLEGIGS